MFVRQTNRYAEQTLADPTKIISLGSSLQNWVQVTSKEIMAFMIVIFNMGLNVKPTLKSYWGKNDSQHVPWFGQMFSRRRFENI